jgi:hypothetical protein
LYFDAKIELKKQQNKDEKLLEMESNEVEPDEANEMDYTTAYNNSSDNYAASTLQDYAILLIPFYDKYKNVPLYFQKLLQSKDMGIQLSAAKVMLANGKTIPDSLFGGLAASDRYRVKLLSMLESINLRELFPLRYKKQEIIAKSLLLNAKDYKGYADIKLVSQRLMEIKGTKGNVYFFKYKIRKDDDWKMGISGIQPVNRNEVSSNSKFVQLTNRKLKPDEPELSQFNEQLKKLLLARHKGAKKFYANSGSLDFSANDGEE